MVRVGDTFFFQLADQYDHLWVIITSPTGLRGNFIAANMTSIKNGLPMDSSCLLHPGDHPFVRKPTEVHYIRAREWHVNGFDSMSSYGSQVKKHSPVSKAVLYRIQKGAIKSPFLKERLKEVVRSELGL
jgi:hypothetical protein